MSSRKRRQRARRAALAALLALVVAGGAALGVIAAKERSDERDAPLVIPSNPGPFRGNPLPKGIDRRPAPSFRLTDARGGELGTRELRGRPYALTFLYATCPDVCPLIAAELGRALELLGPRADQVAAVAVSVDPRSDTPEAVRRFLRRHRLPRNFHYLLGSRRELRPVWKGYFVAPQPAGGAESRHSASIWLVDARGRWRTKFSAGIPVRPRDVAHDLGVLLREVRSSGSAAR